MTIRKISLDIDDELYFIIKKEALERRVTMGSIIRDLLTKRYQNEDNKQAE